MAGGVAPDGIGLARRCAVFQHAGMLTEPLPLTREDRAILALERGAVVGHCCKVIAVAGSAAPDAETVRRRLAARLDAAPLLRRRLGGSEHAPAWESADDLDLDAHVVDAIGARPLDRRALCAVVAELFTRRLDRSRPLWRVDVAGPLAEGGVALVWRIHHALADGQTAMRLLEEVLWDAAPATASSAPAPSNAAAQHGGGHSALGFARREFADRHRSPFDGRIGATREIAFASTPLQALHDAARRHGSATVNDAVLAVVAGGLRRWIERRHGSLGNVRVRVPVSLHHPGDGAGNRDSFFGVDLPLHERDPIARLEAIHAETAECKADHDAETMDALLRELARVSPPLEGLCERIEGSPRAFALAVSNVPGPRRAVAVLGAPVTALHSIAEIGERHALRVTAVSLVDTLHFGLCADPEIVPGVAGLADDLAAEAAALTGG
jgi:diacylglycerol O-acyltransferase